MTAMLLSAANKKENDGFVARASGLLAAHFASKEPKPKSPIKVARTFGVILRTAQRSFDFNRGISGLWKKRGGAIFFTLHNIYLLLHLRHTHKYFAPFRF